MEGEAEACTSNANVAPRRGLTTGRGTLLLLRVLLLRVLRLLVAMVFLVVVLLSGTPVLAFLGGIVLERSCGCLCCK